MSQESQTAELASVQDDDRQPSPVPSDVPDGELDAQLSEQQAISSEPADSQAEEVQSENGTLSVSNSQDDENVPPQELMDPEAPAAKPVRKVSATSPTKKGPMSVNTNAAAKANGGPTTPLVKKVHSHVAYRRICSNLVHRSSTLVLLARDPSSQRLASGRLCLAALLAPNPRRLQRH